MEEMQGIPQSVPEDYTSMLSMLGMAPDAPFGTGFMLGDAAAVLSAKRPLDLSEENRDTKRPRFEVVE